MNVQILLTSERPISPEELKGLSFSNAAVFSDVSGVCVYVQTSEGIKVLVSTSFCYDHSNELNTDGRYHASLTIHDAEVMTLEEEALFSKSSHNSPTLHSLLQDLIPLEAMIEDITGFAMPYLSLQITNLTDEQIEDKRNEITALTDPDRVEDVEEEVEGTLYVEIINDHLSDAPVKLIPVGMVFHTGTTDPHDGVDTFHPVFPIILSEDELADLKARESEADKLTV